MAKHIYKKIKAFIIHTSHPDSLEYAQKCVKSFHPFDRWDIEMFEGLTKETIPEFESKHNIRTKKHSRAMAIKKSDLNMYNTKKSCSLNHYRLAKKCIELNHPIAVIEHDSHCIKSWDNPKFEDNI